MRRRPNMVKTMVVASIRQDVSHAVHRSSELIGSAFGPSRTVEEHALGPLETAAEASGGSPVAHPVTSVTAGNATPQADELLLEATKPAEEFSGVTEAQVKAPAAFVDEGLISQPTPTRANLTTVIHPKITNMEYAIEYQESVLYEKQKGQWVAEPLPEKTVEKVTPIVPTYPNNGVLDSKRTAVHA